MVSYLRGQKGQALFGNFESRTSELSHLMGEGARVLIHLPPICDCLSGAYKVNKSLALLAYPALGPHELPWQENLPKQGIGDVSREHL